MGRILFCLFLLTFDVIAQQETTNENGLCDCMEYWKCVMAGGEPKSHCGPSDSLMCCFLPAEAAEVGLVPPPNITKSTECGHKGTNSGEDGVAEFSEWPWHAAILERSTDLYICGASLIDERWLVTAAHCIDEYSDSAGQVLKVRLGEHDVTNHKEPIIHQEFDVELIVLHEFFNNRTLANDIALIRLARRVRKRPHIDIICLPTRDLFAEDLMQYPCYITGWGRRSDNGSYSLVLKEVSIPIWKQDECQTILASALGEKFVLPDTAICAGRNGQDACDGDGGGPLVCFIDDKWQQAGIVSFGLGCSKKDVPGVYTRVTAYYDWIMDVVRRF